eukprot:CAMPEP_0171280314 /NCGR_PEP_ID=MMETSP0790-20130122/65833_1 /TAXON_ID=2925 /ORGANISM="Alexandrium catenella, Strain OF101" /LENGTH=32 /DNA_ID= /DNA_START= /DNA_END= /DNA_ORIENTATION=
MTTEASEAQAEDAPLPDLERLHILPFAEADNV